MFIQALHVQIFNVKFNSSSDIKTLQHLIVVIVMLSSLRLALHLQFLYIDFLFKNV